MPSAADELSGPRVSLQPLAASGAHFSLYQAVYGDPAVMRLVAEAVPQARMQASFDASLQASVSAHCLPSRWCLFDRSSGRGVGLAGSSRDASAGQVELGVLLLPGARGMGYARETLSVLMDAYGQRAGVTRFWGRHHPDNAPMARAFERLCFKRTGVADGLCVWQRSSRAGDPVANRGVAR